MVEDGGKSVLASFPEELLGDPVMEAGVDSQLVAIPQDPFGDPQMDDGVDSQQVSLSPNLLGNPQMDNGDKGYLGSLPSNVLGDPQMDNGDKGYLGSLPSNLLGDPQMENGVKRELDSFPPELLTDSKMDNGVKNDRGSLQPDVMEDPVMEEKVKRDRGSLHPDLMGDLVMEERVKNDRGSLHPDLLGDPVMEEGVDSDFVSLPPELLLPILKQLPIDSLCQIVLTCKYLHQVGSDPDLWSHMVINKVKVKNEGIKGIFKVQRFFKLKHLNLATVGVHLTTKDLEEVLTYVNTRANQGQTLQTLDLQGTTKLQEVSSELVSTGLVQVQTLSLKNARLTTPLINAILENIPESSTLQELDMDDVYLGGTLSPVNPRLLAEAVQGLRKVSLNSSQWLGTGVSTNLNPEQCTLVFSRSLASSTLEELNMYGSNLSSVPPQLLNKAVCRLRRVNLGHYCLGYATTQEASDLQITSLFTALPKSATLQCIKFYNTDMSRIDPVCLAKAVCHIPEVELRHVHLTASHLNEIVKRKLEQEDTLKELDISNNDFSDFSECWRLAQALARMRRVNLELTRLSSKQVIVILRAIQKISHQGSTVLQKLYLLDNPKQDILTQVPIQLLLQKFVIVKSCTW